MSADTDALLAQCRFRVSKRARYLRITVSARQGVVVTRPARVSQAETLAFVISRQAWITRQLQHIAPKAAALPPAQLPLRLTEETLHMHYIDSAHPTSSLQEAGDRLILTFDPTHPERGRKVLSDWLKRRARRVLEPHLQALSQQTDLPYNRLSLRLQRTRWGSCSARRDISLNAKLLFLPLAQVRHVLIHELAHTVHLDHSPAFWRLVERHDPQWRLHRGQLRQAGPLVPAWLDQR